MDHCKIAFSDATVFKKHFKRTLCFFMSRCQKQAAGLLVYPVHDIGILTEAVTDFIDHGIRRITVLGMDKYTARFIEKGEVGRLKDRFYTLGGRLEDNALKRSFDIRSAVAHHVAVDEEPTLGDIPLRIGLSEIQFSH